MTTVTKNAVSSASSDPDEAWARYQPDDEHPWNPALAGHLYRRAGFGADYAQLRQAIVDGPQKTVDTLITPKADVETFNQTYDDYERPSAGSESADGLGAWWLRRMITTPHPLLEKMTLFWHSHLAVANTRVKNAGMMQAHTQLLRKHALGSFDSLLMDISRDPATLLSVDAAENRKAAPNENFARVLLDAFTAGPGQYTDQDVAEAARAFTGSFVRRAKHQYIPREHDDNPKQILGHSGTFRGEDVVQMTVEHPATAKRLVRRLYRWFVSEVDDPEDTLLSPLVESFARDYNVLTLAGKILRSNHFFSTTAYRRRIKSPVEFALGIVKGFEAMLSTSALAEDIARLGQNLYHPPTAKGWPGGRHWINEATLIGRHNLVASMLDTSSDYGKKVDPWAVAARHDCSTVDSAGHFLTDLFLQGDVQSSIEPKTVNSASAGSNPADTARSLACSILTLPEFNLA